MNIILIQISFYIILSLLFNSNTIKFRSSSISSKSSLQSKAPPEFQIQSHFSRVVKMAIKSRGITKRNLPEELKKLLRAVASEWGDKIEEMEESLEVSRLTGAMTNEVYEIKWLSSRSGDQPRKVVVRMYGEGVEIFFNRDDEIRTFECLSKHGQGPRLLGRFSHGRIEEFINAKVCKFYTLFNFIGC